MVEFGSGGDRRTKFSGCHETRLVSCVALRHSGGLYGTIFSRDRATIAVSCLTSLRCWSSAPAADVFGDGRAWAAPSAAAAQSVMQSLLFVLTIAWFLLVVVATELFSWPNAASVAMVVLDAAPSPARCSPCTARTGHTAFGHNSAAQKARARSDIPELPAPAIGGDSG